MSRILFVMLHPGFVRYYDDALTALAADGHDVHVAFEITRRKLGEGGGRAAGSLHPAAAALRPCYRGASVAALSASARYAIDRSR